MTAKTGAQRQTTLEASKKAAGLMRVVVWAHPADAKAIRAFAAQVAANRLQTSKDAA